MKVLGESLQEVSIQDVNPGTEVLTWIDGEYQLTKVVSNQRSAVTSGHFVQVMAAGRRLQVTENHNVMVLRNGVSKMVQASNVLVGDVMWGVAPFHAARSSSVPSYIAEMAVEDIKYVQLPHKNELITEEGTVLANDMVVSTICDDASYEKYPDATAALAAWKFDHIWKEAAGAMMGVCPSSE